MFTDWKIEQEKLTDYFNCKISKCSFDRNIYLFGAHVNTQFLLAFGLQDEKIKGVIDNNPSKQGRRLYETAFKVYATEILKDQNTPIVILRSGTHNDEIKQGILKASEKTEIWEETEV